MANIIKINGKDIKDVKATQDIADLKSQLDNMSQPDWNQSDSSADDFIKNKPAIRQQANGGGILENGASSASGQNSHAEGGGTTASGAYSHAEGGGTTSSGQGSHAEGSGAEATGNYSHAEGAGAKAIGAGAHAEGSGTTASSSSSHAEGESTTASGGGAHSEGGGTTASGNASHAEGGSTTASGRSSHAEGGGTVASGDYSHAEGSNTTANHMAQHVFGMHNIPDASTESSGVKGNYVEIVGNGLDVSRRSNARTLDWEGNEEVAGDIIAYGCGGTNPISLADIKSQKLDTPNGTSTTSIIVNTENITTSVESDWDNPHGVASTTARFPRGDVYFVEFDGNTYKLNSQLIAVENKFKVVEFLGNISLYTSTAGFMGNVYDVPFCIISDLDDNGRIDVITETSGSYSIKISKEVVNGYGLDAQYIYDDAYKPLQYVPHESSTYSKISLGTANTITNRGGIAIGAMNKVNGGNSFAIGVKNKTDHAYSICIGVGNISSGDTSYAEGIGTKASGDYSHSEGQSTESSGQASHSEGYQNVASGQYSHVEGNANVAADMSAHAEGTGNQALASGSHVEGCYSTANSGAWYGHAEGYKTQVSGNSAHAEGRQSNASGNYSHAEGRATVASGNYSHAEGYATTSSGGQSHAAGNSTIAAGNNQYAFGKFNVSDTNNEYIEIAGNGTADDARSNARTLDWSGNESLAGSITLGKGTADEVTLSAAQLKQLLALLN